MHALTRYFVFTGITAAIFSMGYWTGTHYSKSTPSSPPACAQRMGNIPGHRLGNDLATNELTTRDLNNANDNLPATSPKSDAGKFRLRHALLM